MLETEAKNKTCPYGVAPKCLVSGCVAWKELFYERTQYEYVTQHIVTESYNPPQYECAHNL